MCYFINVYKGIKIKPIRRRPKKYFLSEEIYSIDWVCENKGLKHDSIPYTYETLTEEIVINGITSVVDYINHRHDCSDFRLLSLLFFKYEGKEFIDAHPNVEKMLKDCFLNFKFWIKSKGYDSLCYYSENHLISFATIEYLLGDLYPNEVFSIDNQTGKKHKEIALKRMNEWFELRERFGFSEFYSCNYLPINLAILAFLVRYSHDDDIINKATNTINTLLIYYGSTLFDNTFINANGRDYPRNILNADKDEPNSKMIIEPIWGDKEVARYLLGGTSMFFTFFVLKDFKVDEEIINLANKEDEVKASFGLDLKDYKKEGLYGLDDKSLMMQLGCGALTNPEIIENTLDMIHTYDLWRNDFVSWMRFIESPLLRKLHLMPFASKVCNYFSNGMSLGKANIYTYKTKEYKLSTLQNYYPKSSGAQKHTIIATLPNGVTVFTNHPLREDLNRDDSPQFSGDRSPSYFGGYGVAPSAFQHQNVALVIYNIPVFKCMFCKFKMLHYTHAFLSEELMDEVIIDKNIAFGRVNDTYIALIGKNKLEYLPYNASVASSAYGRLEDASKNFDLIQKGRHTFWIYELSSKKEETFDEFISRIKSNTVSFKKNTLSYKSKKSYEAKYDSYFKVDNETMNTSYEGYNSNYITTEQDGIYINNKKVVSK